MTPLEPQPIDRTELLGRLRADTLWDAVIIGGGATGLGIAVDAAARGLKVALVEAQDFAAGTSSRSTKLVHGGVRYLAQGNVKLVREALAERATLLAIAPHIVRPLEFVGPCDDLFERPFLRIGLGLYDLLAGTRSVGPTRWLSAAETCARLPGVRQLGLRGGVSYWDAQFDDARMAIALMQTAYALGAIPINYVRCVSLERGENAIESVTVEDTETGERLRLRARCVFNAAGVWLDGIRHMADAGLPAVVRPSQGAHVVVDRAAMPGSAALLIPKTPDGRVLFAVPWYGAVLLGTTDEPRDDAPLDPQASEQEVAFILQTARGYLADPLPPERVLATFAGLRPLYSIASDDATAKVSREHAVLRECGNLVSIVGGKWTTYRRMAADAMEAAERCGLAMRSTDTAQLPLVRDRVLEDAADRADAIAAAADQLARFRVHCERYTQARSATDVMSRRLRLGMTRRLPARR